MRWSSIFHVHSSIFSPPLAAPSLLSTLLFAPTQARARVHVHTCINTLPAPRAGLIYCVRFIAFVVFAIRATRPNRPIGKLDITGGNENLLYEIRVFSFRRRSDGFIVRQILYGEMDLRILQLM